MRRPRTLDEDTAARALGAGVGAALLASSGLSALLALQHMQAVAAICGQSGPHCGWCAAAAGFALAGAGALAAALRRTPAKARA